ncbi:unnamed protein product [Gongylonema pulchrum]|uniref:Uncharacterized protein n=1 Tax=Gongylonema pulchrum TaxID=637853 RepID=A0A183E2I8_9BILA|nr:unnamed protein product [Gongylonema pulchrum]
MSLRCRQHNHLHRKPASRACLSEPAQVPSYWGTRYFDPVAISALYTALCTTALYTVPRYGPTPSGIVQYHALYDAIPYRAL